MIIILVCNMYYVRHMFLLMNFFVLNRKCKSENRFKIQLIILCWILAKAHICLKRNTVTQLRKLHLISESTFWRQKIKCCRCCYLSLWKYHRPSQAWEVAYILVQLLYQQTNFQKKKPCSWKGGKENFKTNAYEEASRLITIE